MQLLALVLALLVSNPSFTALYNDVESRRDTISEQELNTIYTYIIGDDVE